ncbi:hypothetical protein AMTR_s00067p00142800 [Amborella trichopoda]|uniref:Pentacotripeptide-repeat region of PRORP domain-containing protein n=1 Tax=Amborella trichopoda TaxID=13333 RepID=U5D8R2_AMBTC|nr:hypothetical protein AMTR_s00067p00142800 [Amborella trichopoda]
MAELGLSHSLYIQYFAQGLFKNWSDDLSMVFFIEMKKRASAPDATKCTTLMHGFGRAGDIDKACKYLKE